jgi:hypothetical protein
MRTDRYHFVGLEVTCGWKKLINASLRNDTFPFRNHNSIISTRSGQNHDSKVKNLSWSGVTALFSLYATETLTCFSDCQHSNTVTFSEGLLSTLLNITWSCFALEIIVCCTKIGEVLVRRVISSTYIPPRNLQFCFLYLHKLLQASSMLRPFI